jgi:hypothetical protein
MTVDLGGVAFGICRRVGLSRADRPDSRKGRPQRGDKSNFSQRTGHTNPRHQVACGHQPRQCPSSRLFGPRLRWSAMVVRIQFHQREGRPTSNSAACAKHQKSSPAHRVPLVRRRRAQTTRPTTPRPKRGGEWRVRGRRRRRRGYSSGCSSRARRSGPCR